MKKWNVSYSQRRFLLLTNLRGDVDKGGEEGLEFAASASSDNAHDPCENFLFLLLTAQGNGDVWGLSIISLFFAESAPLPMTTGGVNGNGKKGNKRDPTGQRLLTLTQSIPFLFRHVYTKMEFKECAWIWTKMVEHVARGVGKGTLFSFICIACHRHRTPPFI